MPPIDFTLVLSPTTPVGDESSALISTLHNELTLVAGPVDQGEVTANTFGQSTTNGVLLFQGQFGLAETGEVDSSTGALLTATAKYYNEGNTSAVRGLLNQELQAALDNPDDARADIGVLAVELAQYQVLAGEYSEARSTLDIFNRLDREWAKFATLGREKLNRILADPVDVPDEPETPYPGNFYTYQYSFFTNEEADQLTNHLELELSKPVDTTGIPGTPGPVGPAGPGG